MLAVVVVLARLAILMLMVRVETEFSPPSTELLRFLVEVAVALR